MIRIDGMGSNGSLTLVNSEVGATATGNAGNLEISTGSLSLSNGAQLGASTRGQGDAGNVIIRADSVSFDGVSNGFASGALSTVETTGKGQGGNVIIDTGSLSLTNGARLISSTFGQGNAGGVNVQASERVFLNGVSSDGLASGIFSTVEAGVIGNAGNISVSAKSLSVNNGAALSSSTRGQGDAGNISISVRDTTTFDGVGSNGFSSQVGSQVVSTGVGKAGNINLTTGSLSLTNGGALSSTTFGQGDAGNITLIVRDVATFDGVGSNGFSSQVSSTVNASAVGNGGSISLSTGSLTVTNGALLISSTDGQGSAGNITLVVKDATIFDGQGINRFYSQAASEVGVTAKGNGGNISLATGSLTVKNGGVLGSGTFGQGDAGNINIVVRDATTFDGVANDGGASSAISQVETGAVGKGGNISLTTGSLTLTNGAALISGTLGQGNGGNISIDVHDTLLAKDSSITTRSNQFSSGNITVNARNILLRGNSDITTDSSSGDGGNITLTAKTIVALGDSDILAFARDGRGGNITLNTPAFFGQNYRPAPFGTDPRTLDGNNRVDVNASGTVSGVITLPDTSFIQNGLTTFSQTLVDPSKLLANSCIVRRNRDTDSSFFITGSGGLPARPGDLPLSSFPTGEVQNVAADSPTDKKSTPPASSTSNASPDRPWKIGDPIVEPQGVYQLPNGELVMSRECPNAAPNHNLRSASVIAH